MSSLKTFDIELDQCTYMPGDLVTGEVIIELVKSKKIKALTVSVNGEANVEWETIEKIREKPEKRKKSVKVRFHANEIYITANYCLLGSTANHAELQLTAGIKKYPFSFQLPYNIPCSFEHTYGYIRYTIKALIHRPGRYAHQTEISFTIITPYDLNLYSHNCLGIDEKIYESTGCCNSGTIKVCITSPTTGFVPGQPINTMVYFKNLSSANVTKICYKLERILEFKSKIPHVVVKRIYTVIKKEQYQNVMGEEDNIVSNLEIPSILPSELQFCNIINQRYKLRITIHMSGLNSKIVGSYPIVIGTIPLRSMLRSEPVVSSYPQTMPPPTAPSVNNIENPPITIPMPAPMLTTSSAHYSNSILTGANSSNQSDALTNRWDIPPPSYEEATGTNCKIQ